MDRDIYRYTIKIIKYTCKINKFAHPVTLEPEVTGS